MKVTEIGVRLSGIYVVCPHCKKEIDGWCVDPRGKKTTCDFCDKPIEIHRDAHFQREEGDQRPDNIIKEEIFWRDIAPRFNVCFCVDDRNTVVKMWRELGLECWQCQWGDF